ncbi:hypothetical protein HanXRQr2_Chr02g0046481 [Helianthus annuus]|uniref:Uncharacterized protein n=1 Tax=Helianthus annuus TaxID=4232 RepID=A0A9K3NZF8_HELAN|nr:hypothetical protein HanXRQr2_Chr02g0046481 [Helianthus annuus]
MLLLDHTYHIARIDALPVMRTVEMKKHPHQQTSTSHLLHRIPSLLRLEGVVLVPSPSISVAAPPLASSKSSGFGR